ncbi:MULTISPECIES: NADP-dependent oxidoreductase [unclassified Salinivibrio]|uniref:NADP-dependent oxidoreductase n=1 Tax=unclassified Salinivibrio TaxID=2636825 RepID=UPI00098588B9|nr:MULTISPECIES: NADP-dependent oxidoreductase [unclassified Salinivibrio]NUY56849.1 NADP-dependent oxidoreductase [Salinivibrio sp. EAGSL]OOE94631.1 NADPH:quinone reductase [Salinivibrio sp. AR640]
MSNNLSLAITEFGAPEVLSPVNRAIPSPSEEQVLIQVKAAGVNPIDAKTRAGLGWAAEHNQDKLPWVPGYDVAGVVVANGTNESKFDVGDRVAGMIGFPTEGGGYSQYVAADAGLLSTVPPSVPMVDAAAVPLAGLTAWQALEHVKLTRDEKILILAGAGGVGHLAVQLAVRTGAQVYATASPGNHEFLRQLDAKPIDYHQAHWATAQGEFDVLIDLVGGDTGIEALASLKTGGRVVTVPTNTRDMITAAAAERGLKATGMLVEPNTWQTQRLLDMLDQGELHIDIAAVYPLEQGAQAHKALESGHTRGKRVLEMPSS